MKKLNNSGFSTVEGLLIVVAILFIGGISFYVFKVNQDNRKQVNLSTPIANNEATQPEQQPTPKQEVPAQQSFLTIQEMGVKLPLSESIKDAYYDNKDIATAPDIITFSLKSRALDAEPDCKNSSASTAVITRVPVGKEDPRQSGKKYSDTQADKGKVIGEYFYFVGLAQYPCAQDPNNQKILERVRTEFSDAGKNISTITP